MKQHGCEPALTCRAHATPLGRDRADAELQVQNSRRPLFALVLEPTYRLESGVLTIQPGRSINSMCRPSFSGLPFATEGISPCVVQARLEARWGSSYCRIGL